MLKTPYVNSENTWGWIMQPIFWIHPTISFHGLVLTLFIIQISMLWFFFYYLAHMRISGLYIFILSIVSISVTSKQMPYLIFTQYPMLLPGLLFPIALLGFSIRYKWYQRRVLHAVFSCGIGAYLFFLYNLRTPYIIPAVIVLAVYYLLLRPMRASSLYSFLLVIVTSIFCYISIQKSVFPPEFEKNKSLYLSTHPIAHPLVLGLAIPANRFAKKLGIEWNDSIGERIALNADPTVKLDSPKYDEVLLSYYKSLWVNYPKDMFRLYFEKFNSLGHDFAPDNRIIRLFMFPLNKLNGMMIMFIQFMILYLLLKNRNKLNACFLFGSLSFSLAGIALYIESGIIYSIYNACYHGFLTLWFVSLNLTFLSLLIYYLFHLIERKLLAGKHKRQDPLSSQLSS